MEFTWDEEKNRRNRAKLDVSFQNAMVVFDDPYALTVRDRMVEGQERWHTVGLVCGMVVLLVVHTYGQRDDDLIRIISARRATRSERRKYEQARQAIEAID